MRMTDLGHGGSPLVSYSCPSWCIRTDHDADVVDASNPPRHYGPEFPDAPVLVAVQGWRDGPYEAVIYTEGNLFISDAHDLRRLAAELLKAAEWLESRA